MLLTEFLQYFFPLVLSFQMIISGYVFNLVLFKENFNYKKKYLFNFIIYFFLIYF